MKHRPLVLASLLLGLSGPALAKDSLVELLQDGQREAALAALNDSDLDVNATTADGATALHWAAYQVDLELLKALLDKGANADVTNAYGSTPLGEAVKLGNLEMVRTLLDAGADPDSPNQDNQTALMLAAYLGELEIAELLIEKGADVNAVESFRGQTALMWASGENHPELAKLLVEHGADVSVRATFDDWQRQMTSEPRAQFRPTGGLTALLYATRSGCLGCAQAIVEAGADINQPNPDGITPLLNALDNKSFDIAMYLIDQGANVHVWDMHGRTPIYMAVDMNSFVPRSFFGTPLPEDLPEQQFTAMDVVNRLLAMGVDVNHQLTRMRPNGPGRGRFADYMMRGGTGPLLVATMEYDLDAMQALLANGAEVDLHNVFKITPLMAAAGMSGSGRGGMGPDNVEDVQGRVIETIDLLLDHGADINQRILDSHTYTAKLDTYVTGRDHEGKTALFSAAEAGWDRVVAHLIERGADPTMQDAYGKTALDIALAPVVNGPGARNGPRGGDREATVAVLSKALTEAGVDISASLEAAENEKE